MPSHRRSHSPASASRKPPKRSLFTTLLPEPSHPRAPHRTVSTAVVFLFVVTVLWLAVVEPDVVDNDGNTTEDAILRGMGWRAVKDVFWGSSAADSWGSASSEDMGSDATADDATYTPETTTLSVGMFENQKAEAVEQLRKDGALNAYVWHGVEEGYVQQTSGRLIIVGDIHGQHETLSKMMSKLQLSRDDTLLHTGDLVSKAPLNDSLLAVRLMRTLGARGVRGNHDHGVVQWRKWMESYGRLSSDDSAVVPVPIEKQDEATDADSIAKEQTNPKGKGREGKGRKGKGSKDQEGGSKTYTGLKGFVGPDVDEPPAGAVGGAVGGPGQGAPMRDRAAGIAGFPVPGERRVIKRWFGWPQKAEEPADDQDDETVDAAGENTPAEEMAAEEEVAEEMVTEEEAVEEVAADEPTSDGQQNDPETSDDQETAEETSEDHQETSDDQTTSDDPLPGEEESSINEATEEEGETTEQASDEPTPESDGTSADDEPTPEGDLAEETDKEAVHRVDAEEGEVGGEGEAGEDNVKETNSDEVDPDDPGTAAPRPSTDSVPHLLPLTVSIGLSHGAFLDAGWEWLSYSQAEAEALGVVIPKGWEWGGEWFEIARHLPRVDADYLESLPLTLWLDGVGGYLVHAGMLPWTSLESVKAAPSAQSEVPPEVLTSTSLVAFDPSPEDAERLVSASSSLLLVPENTDPFTLLNVRALKKRRKGTFTVTNKKKGMPWNELWETRMEECAALDGCEQVPVVYGHWAAKGLDVRNTTIGLDSACAAGGQLSALVLPALHPTTYTVLSDVTHDPDSDASPDPADVPSSDPAVEPIASDSIEEPSESESSDETVEVDGFRSFKKPSGTRPYNEAFPDMPRQRKRQRLALAPAPPTDEETIDEETTDEGTTDEGTIDEGTIDVEPTAAEEEEGETTADQPEETAVEEEKIQDDSVEEPEEEDDGTFTETSVQFAGRQGWIVQVACGEVTPGEVEK